MITPKRPMQRRTFLRGAIGGTTIALAIPTLEAMLPRSARAADLADPIFGLFYWANGLPWTELHGGEQAGHPDLWTPTTTGPGYAPTELLAPLAAHNVSVATGLEPKTEIPAVPDGQSDGHMRGFMVAMTADRIRPEGFDHPSHTLTALRPTMDQYVAKHDDFYGKTPTRFRSLEVGISPARFHDYGHWNAISYNGPDSLNPAIMDPAQLYAKLFNVPGDLVALGRRAQLLDAVRDDAQSLRLRLGAGDRARLDEHLSHLSEVQRRLQLTSGTCDMIPAAPADSGDLFEKTGIMGELLAAALRCDLTRVFSFMLTSPASTHVFANVGVPDGMHKVCHDGSWDFVKVITLYQMQCFARLLDLLEAAVDPMGNSLMDRALIFGVSEYGEGFKHSDKEMPVILAGGCNGAINRGVHYREQDGNLCKVHVTILRALGIECPSYGFNGAETTEALTGILA
jgi:hypothetical protein